MTDLKPATVFRLLAAYSEIETAIEDLVERAWAQLPEGERPQAVSELRALTAEIRHTFHRRRNTVAVHANQILAGDRPVQDGPETYSLAELRGAQTVVMPDIDPEDL